MSLKYNSYRENRYFRSFLKDGRYLLANEARDLQLENIQLTKKILENTFGEQFCVEDSLAVSRSAAKVLTINLDKDSVGTASITDKPAVGYYKGIPIIIDRDALVSIGSTSGVGTPAVSTSSNNVTITFASSTIAQHSLVLSLEEQRVTGDTGSSTADNIKETFLRRTNLGESTGEKRRLVYKLNIMPTSQISSVIAVATRLSQLDYYDQMTLQQGVHYTNTATGAITGSNGEDYYVDFDDFGGSNYTPDPSETDYTFGTLIDNRGNEFTIVDIYDSPTGGTYVRYELDCPKNISGTTVAPVVSGAGAYIIFKKRNFYVSDAFGIPSGKLFFELCRFTFSDVNGTIDAATLIDLRNVISFRSWNQDRNLVISDGGSMAWGFVANTWSWGSTLRIQNPIGGASGANFTIAAGSAVLAAAGDCVYVQLDEPTGKRLDGGALTVSVTSTATLSNSENIFVLAWRGTDGRLYIRDHGAYSYGLSGWTLGHNASSVDVASRGTTGATAVSPINFFGAQDDTVTYTSTGSPFMIEEPSPGMATIQYGGLALSIGTGEGAAHPTKPWDHRADFEGINQTPFLNMISYVGSLDINTAEEGCIVNIKPGTYTFSAVMQTDNGGVSVDKLRIIGSGPNTVLTRSANVNIMQFNTDYIEIENVEFKDDGSGANALLNIDNSYIKVKNCRFTNMANGSLAISATGSYIEIENCYFSGAGAANWTAIQMETPGVQNAYIKINNNITDTTNYPEYFIISNDLRYSEIKNNSVTIDKSMVSSSSGTRFNYIKIIDNIITDQKQATYGSIQFNDLNWKESILIANNIQVTGSGFFFYGSDDNAADQTPSNIEIIDNQITSNTGICFDFDSSSSRIVTNLNISNNNIITTSAADPSIHILCSTTGGLTLQNLNISNNTINAGCRAIRLYWPATSTGAVIFNNTNINNNQIITSGATHSPIFFYFAKTANDDNDFTFYNLSINENNIYTTQSVNGIHFLFSQNNATPTIGVNFYGLSINNNQIKTSNTDGGGILLTSEQQYNTVLLDKFSIDGNIIESDIESIALYFNYVGDSNVGEYWNFLNGSISNNKIYNTSTDSGENCIDIVINHTGANRTVAIQNISICRNEIKFNDDDLIGIYCYFVCGETITIENLDISSNNIYGTASLQGIYCGAGVLDSCNNIKISDNNIYINNSSAECYGINAGSELDGIIINNNKITLIADTNASDVYGIKAAGDYAVLSSNNIQIRSSGERNVAYCLDSDGSYSTINNNVISFVKTGSDADAITVTGISSGTYTSISSNQIRIEDPAASDNVGDSMYGIQNAAYNTISGNNIYIVAQDIAHWAYGIYNNNYTYLTITGNLCYLSAASASGTKIGIQLGSGDYLSVTGNVVENFNDNAIDDTGIGVNCVPDKAGGAGFLDIDQVNVEA